MKYRVKDINWDRGFAFFCFFFCFDYMKREVKEQVAASCSRFNAWEQNMDKSDRCWVRSLLSF